MWKSTTSPVWRSRTWVTPDPGSDDDTSASDLVPSEKEAQTLLTPSKLNAESAIGIYSSGGARIPPATADTAKDVVSTATMEKFEARRGSGFAAFVLVASKRRSPAASHQMP